MWTPFLFKRHKHDQCLFLSIGFEEEGSEEEEVMGVPSRSEASPELILSSSTCNECEFCVDSVVVVRPSPVSVVSKPVVTSCGTEMCVEEWCQSDRG